jgi:hypothetical protein
MIRIRIADNNISGIEFLNAVSEDKDELIFWVKSYKKMWYGYSPIVTELRLDDKLEQWVCTASRWTSCD